AEVPVLLLAHLHAGFRRVSVLDDGRKRAHHLAIETRNAMRGAGTDVERDVRHAQHDTAKAALVRRMHVDAVTPRADRLDTFVPSSGLRTCVRRSSSAARSGTTNPVMPRSTSGCPVGRWNWLMPTLTHMLPTPVLRNGSRVRPRPVL